MRIFLPIIFSIFVLFFYTLPDVNANSEFFVSNTKGSYNLGCELDNSCFEPYLVKIAPYLITILVLVILTIYKEGKTGAPGNIGRPFFRENR